MTKMLGLWVCVLWPLQRQKGPQIRHSPRFEGLPVLVYKNWESWRCKYSTIQYLFPEASHKQRPKTADKHVVVKIVKLSSPAVLSDSELDVLLLASVFRIEFIAIGVCPWLA